MGIYNEQIRNRITADNDAFANSLENMTSALTEGRIRLDEHFAGNVENAKDAIGAVLKYYRVKPRKLPNGLTQLTEQLEYLLRPTGIMWRDIELTPNWWKDCSGALLATKKDGTPVALLPRTTIGYTMFDPSLGQSVPMNEKRAEELETSAICFYKSLPQKSLLTRDLILFMAGSLNKRDYLMIILATAFAALIGLIPPYANKVVFTHVVGVDINLLLPALCMFLGAAISASAIGMVKKLVLERLNIKLNVAMESAMMMRVLSLPASFFEDYNAGDLSTRVGYAREFCANLSEFVFACGLTSVFSLMYIGQIFSFTPALGLTALLVLALTLGTSLLSAAYQVRHTRRVHTQRAKLSGLALALLSGVQKLRLSGSERRGFAKWANENAKNVKLQYNPPFMIRFSSVIASLVSLSGVMLLYVAAVKGNVRVGDYMAFTASYGLVMGAVLSLSSMTTQIANIKPALEMIKPVLKAVPESGESKEILESISGKIELNEVCFRYKSQGRDILNELSFKIFEGQYVAIVGRTGCGKSTLMKLLLGFESPQKGAIYYDDKDIQSLDLRSLRRHMGVVLQDSRLFSGSVFSNIAVSAPHLSMDEAWEAAELAGLAEDIRRMPMGMFTMISEGAGGVSGGQRQRIMIARAIAAKPKILMFDEATSALDNITQRVVSESLDRLNCTRIVIAHRLSTIRQCDRILVLDNGHIIEDGCYDELIAKNGYFAELVARQRLDDTA